MTMKKGLYYIGDLCYVMDSVWGEVCDLLFPDNGLPDTTMGRGREGELTLNGVDFAIFGTSFGDGTYKDNHGRSYGVDSGSIGCILVSDIAECDRENISEGNQVEFKKDFDVEVVDGIIVFGNVLIDTNTDGEECGDEEDGDEDLEDRCSECDDEHCCGC